MPFTGAVICLCEEQWIRYDNSECEGGSYGYVLLVHPGCPTHVARLESLQSEIRELRGEA